MTDGRDGRLLLQGSPPQRIVVRGPTTDAQSATPLFSVVADHGHAERLLATGCYERDAHDIADIIGEYLNVEVEVEVAR